MKRKAPSAKKSVWVFWLNDDRDNQENDEQVPASTANSANTTIDTKRDLEDFQQIAIKVPASVKDKILNQNYKLAIQTTGGVQVNVYKAAQAGTSYLFDPDAASSQINDTYTVSSGTKNFKDAVDLNDLSASINPDEYDNPVPFLFEGKTGGEGTIKLVLKKPDDTVELSDEVHVKLKTVTEMYSQVRAKPVNGIARPYDFFPQQPTEFPVDGFVDETPAGFERPANETTQCALFGHGWNVNEARYRQQSAAMFKRLWLTGFKGRFAAIRWPANVAGVFTGSPFQLVQNASAYFEIEYRAFKYATVVKQYADHLSSPAGGGFTVGLIGHSMGNVATSEALRQGAPVTRYVLMNGAIPAGCYDERDLLTLNDQGQPFNPSLPQTEPDRRLPYGGYREYFRDLSGLINFHNAGDDALRQWTMGQRVKRHQYMSQQPGAPNYFFEPGQGVMLKKRPLIPNSPPQPPRAAGPPLGHPHESMTMFAQSRTLAIGAEPRTGGSISGAVDMRGFFGDDNDEHSPQFDRPIQSGGENGVKAFYETVRNRLFPP